MLSGVGHLGQDFLNRLAYSKSYSESLRLSPFLLGLARSFMSGCKEERSE